MTRRTVEPYHEHASRDGGERAWRERRERDSMQYRQQERNVEYRDTERKHDGQLLHTRDQEEREWSERREMQERRVSYREAERKQDGQQYDNTYSDLQDQRARYSDRQRNGDRPLMDMERIQPDSRRGDIPLSTHQEYQPMVASDRPMYPRNGPSPRNPCFDCGSTEHWKGDPACPKFTPGMRAFQYNPNYARQRATQVRQETAPNDIQNKEQLMRKVLAETQKRVGQLIGNAAATNTLPENIQHNASDMLDMISDVQKAFDGPAPEMRGLAHPQPNPTTPTAQLLARFDDMARDRKIETERKERQQQETKMRETHERQEKEKQQAAAQQEEERKERATHIQELEALKAEVSQGRILLQQQMAQMTALLTRQNTRAQHILTTRGTTDPKDMRGSETTTEEGHTFQQPTQVRQYPPNSMGRERQPPMMPHMTVTQQQRQQQQQGEQNDLRRPRDHKFTPTRETVVRTRTDDGEWEMRNARGLWQPNTDDSDMRGETFQTVDASTQQKHNTRSSPRHQQQHAHQRQTNEPTMAEQTHRASPATKQVSELLTQQTLEEEQHIVQLQEQLRTRSPHRSDNVARQPQQRKRNQKKPTRRGTRSYEVRAILDRREKNAKNGRRVVQYKVKWADTDGKQWADEWKNASDLRCNELIKIFEESKLLSERGQPAEAAPQTRTDTDPTTHPPDEESVPPGGPCALPAELVKQVCTSFDLPFDSTMEPFETYRRAGDELCDHIVRQQTPIATMQTGMLEGQTVEAYLLMMYNYLFQTANDPRQNKRITEASPPREIVRAILKAISHDR